MALALPPLPMARIKGENGDSWQLVRVARGQTLGSLFQELDIPAATMQRILAHPGSKEALTRLKPGTELGFDLPVHAGSRRAAHVPLRPRRQPPRRTEPGRRQGQSRR